MTSLWGCQNDSLPLASIVTLGLLPLVTSSLRVDNHVGNPTGMSYLYNTLLQCLSLANMKSRYFNSMISFSIWLLINSFPRASHLHRKRYLFTRFFVVFLLFLEWHLSLSYLHLLCLYTPSHSTLAWIRRTLPRPLLVMTYTYNNYVTIASISIWSTGSENSLFVIYDVVAKKTHDYSTWWSVTARVC